MKLQTITISKILFFLTLFFLISCKENKKDTIKEKLVSKQKPNIIYILADDLGYGDIGAYGQTRIETPNLDKLAKDGMRFTNHYSGSTVCAPSRSVLMTGLHTGHTLIRGNRESKLGEGQAPLPDDAYTMAEMLKSAGYTTGAFGKWGLGMVGTTGDPNAQGFDLFYGYNCQREAHRYYPKHLYHNSEKIILEGNDFTNQEIYAPDQIHEEALKFIRSNKDKSFFAFVPIVQPHAEILAPKDSLLAKYLGKFEETPFLNPKAGSDYGDKDFSVREYTSQNHPKAHFAAMVSRVDMYVGQIRNLVEELGISENTLILFSSDNGPHQEGGADPDFFKSSGDFSGYKRDFYDGGIRVPLIAYWKGKILAGSESDLISAFYDMAPTFTELADMQVPDDLDGISMVPTLLNESAKQEKHEFLYWEFSERGHKQAVRMGKWKGIRLNLLENPDAPIALFDLSQDVKEQHDVASKNHEIVQKIAKIMESEHVVSPLFPLGKLESEKYPVSNNYYN